MRYFLSEFKWLKSLLSLLDIMWKQNLVFLESQRKSTYVHYQVEAREEQYERFIGGTQSLSIFTHLFVNNNFCFCEITCRRVVQTSSSTFFLSCKMEINAITLYVKASYELTKNIKLYKFKKLPYQPYVILRLIAFSNFIGISHDAMFRLNILLHVFIHDEMFMWWFLINKEI